MNAPFTSERIPLVKAVISWYLWRSKKLRWIHRNPHMVPLLQVKKNLPACINCCLFCRNESCSSTENCSNSGASFVGPVGLLAVTMGSRHFTSPFFPGSKGLASGPTTQDRGTDRGKPTCLDLLQASFILSICPANPAWPGCRCFMLGMQTPPWWAVLGHTRDIPTQVPALSGAQEPFRCPLHRILPFLPPKPARVKSSLGGAAHPFPFEQSPTLPWKGIAGDEISSWKWESVPLFRNRNGTCFTAPHESFQHKHPQLHVSAAGRVCLSPRQGREEFPPK